MLRREIVEEAPRSAGGRSPDTMAGYVRAVAAGARCDQISMLILSAGCEEIGVGARNITRSWKG